MTFLGVDELVKFCDFGVTTESLLLVEDDEEAKQLLHTSTMFLWERTSAVVLEIPIHARWINDEHLKQEVVQFFLGLTEGNRP